MEYSQLSDFEINKRVSVAAGLNVNMIFDVDEVYARGPVWTAPTGNCYGGVKSSKGNPFDPCNNPADAWPIIFSNLISVEPDYEFIDPSEEECFASGLWISEYFDGKNKAIRYAHPSPLRAAMIVFLMMKEQSHE